MSDNTLSKLLPTRSQSQPQPQSRTQQPPKKSSRFSRIHNGLSSFVSSTKAGPKELKSRIVKAKESFDAGINASEKKVQNARNAIQKIKKINVSVDTPDKRTYDIVTKAIVNVNRLFSESKRPLTTAAVLKGREFAEKGSAFVKTARTRMSTKKPPLITGGAKKRKHSKKH